MVTPGPEATIAAERAFAARLRAGFARTKRTGAGVHDLAERARRKAARRAANSAAHRRAQEERRASSPPTRKQRQMLWCLGYRGPAPRNQAEVSALVAE